MIQPDTLFKTQTFISITKKTRNKYNMVYYIYYTKVNIDIEYNKMKHKKIPQRT